jgi:DNA (cytosine-5)-methyltransferase 1
LHASDFGVSQLRPRFILVALKNELVPFFRWPSIEVAAPSVGDCLYDLMAENGWEGARAWANAASTIAPTIVGGSKKHGGPDLGPSRAKRQWLELRVNGSSIANEAPGRDTAPDAVPRLTNRMVARLQSFPDDWQFAGKKTSQYRQIGNAFPAAVAKAVAKQIRDAIRQKDIPKIQRGELFASELVAGA